MGDYAEAEATYTQALILAQQQNNLVTISSVLGNLAALDEALGDLETAIIRYTEALANLEILGDITGMVTTYKNRGNVYNELADWGSATKDYQKSLSLAEKSGDRGGQVRALDGLGLIYRHQGDLTSARNFHEKALTLALEFNDHSQIAASQTNLGHVLAAEERREEALEYYQQALETMVKLEDGAGESTVLLNMCITYFGLADFERIPALIDRTRPLATKFRQDDILAKLCWLEGDLSFLDGDNEVGFVYYRQACVWAMQYTDNLLYATLERIDMWMETFLETGQVDQVIHFCQMLQQNPNGIAIDTWEPIQSVYSELESILSTELTQHKGQKR